MAPSPLVDPPTLRASFQLDARCFARVLGVHVATVNRWEREVGGKGGCSIDPHTRSILTVMANLDRRSDAAEVRQAVAEAAQTDGLRALYVLLHAYYDPPRNP